MKLTSEQRAQRIAVLLGKLEDEAKDRAWLLDMVDATQGPARDHYRAELRKAEKKIDELRSELIRLRAIH